MEPEQLAHILEALLFMASKPFKAKELAKILEMEEPQVLQALAGLVEKKKHDGVILLDNNGEYQLATNSFYSTQVKNFLNAELREKLTDATVEVLAIISYRQPISKAEIEAIRGVNSQYSLRNLLMRGLIEKIANPHDARSFLYQTTTEYLMHLGLTSVKDLPEFDKLVEKIKLPQTPALAAESAGADSISNETMVKTTSLEPQVEVVSETLTVQAPPAAFENQSSAETLIIPSALPIAVDNQKTPGAPEPTEELIADEEEDEDDDDEDGE